MTLKEKKAEYDKIYMSKPEVKERRRLYYNSEDQKLKRRLRPVSYTHLTLPTICSV